MNRAVLLGVGASAIAAGVLYAASRRRDTGGPARTLDDTKVNVQMHSAPGVYTVRLPREAYGTALTVSRIQAALRKFRSRSGETAVVWDLSRLGGGPLPPHVSHQTGHDVDIKTPQAIWQMLKAFLEDPSVQYIFLDEDLQRTALEQAQGDSMASRELASGGRVRHASGHVDHLHVRFREVRHA